MIGRINDEFNFNAQALQLRSQRQEVLTANLANAETPNYKARDFDFSTALKEATGGTKAAGNSMTVNLARTQTGHIAGSSTAGLPVAMLYRTPTQDAIDGNTVDPDLERGQFADNALRYDASLRMLNGQIRTMQTVMQNN
jgi:flagellar basal-body rod protein FlgB